MKLPYAEGTAFLVPLRDGGYARGIVARASKKGKGIFGYFFGPRLTCAESVQLDDLNPNKAVLRIRFGDLGLIDGKWPIIGFLPGWNRADWPMPGFVREDLFSGKKWLVRYSDSDPMAIVEQRPIENTRDMLPDRSAGFGAIEIRLSKLL